MLNAPERQRYERQRIMPKISEPGQSKIRNASIFIAGIGGLGSVSACYMTAMGVGRIRLVDRDRTEGADMSRKIKVTLNGCEEHIPEGATIQDLIVLLNETDRHLIVEHNNFLIAPSLYATRAVADGDIVEFINPNMGG